MTYLLQKKERVSQRPLAIDFRIDRSVKIHRHEHTIWVERSPKQCITQAPWLVRESRQREEDCRLLLEALQIHPGQTICDLGCGNGFYTLELARRVGPEGKVYAVDIQPQMLRLLVTRARQEKLLTFSRFWEHSLTHDCPRRNRPRILC